MYCFVAACRPSDRVVNKCSTNKGLFIEKGRQKVLHIWIANRLRVVVKVHLVLPGWKLRGLRNHLLGHWILVVRILNWYLLNLGFGCFF